MGKDSNTFLRLITKSIFIMAILALGIFGRANISQAQTDCIGDSCPPINFIGTCIEAPTTMVHRWTCDTLSDSNNYPFPSGAPSLSLVASGTAALSPGFSGNACSFLPAVSPDREVRLLYGEMSIADDPSLNPGAGSFTVEAWINSGTESNNGNAFIRYGFNAERGMIFYSLTQGTGGVWSGIVSDGNITVEVDGPTAEPGVWHHLALVINRDPTLPVDVVADVLPFPAAILYYDGVEVGRSDISRLGSINPSGFDARMSNNLFTGLVDELSLYNSALSAQQIAQIFTAQSSGMGKVDSDNDGCSDCRDSACDVANLQTRISYQGNYVSNPIYAANAATADRNRINSTGSSLKTKVAVAVTKKYSSKDPATATLVSEMYHLVGAAPQPGNNQHLDSPCALCDQDPNNILACMLCNAPHVIGGPQCGATQPLGLGCKEMTRTELLAGGTCKDTTTNAPFLECCPYPPNMTHTTVTSGQISSTISGNSIFVSDSSGCCILTGGCRVDSSATDSSTDNFQHNYYYDTNAYCSKTPKPTGCP